MGGQITRNAFYGKEYILTLCCSCCCGDLVLKAGGGLGVSFIHKCQLCALCYQVPYCHYSLFFGHSDVTEQNGADGSCVYFPSGSYDAADGTASPLTETYSPCQSGEQCILCRAEECEHDRQWKLWGFPLLGSVLCCGPPLIHKEPHCVQLCFTKSIHRFPIAISHTPTVRSKHPSHRMIRGFKQTASCICKMLSQFDLVLMEDGIVCIF